MKQEITSAKTSINQIPAIFKKISWEGKKCCLDIGSGKYNTCGQWLVDNYGVEYLPYDPYNRTEEENATSLSKAQNQCDVIVLANVLNVIKEKEVRLDVLRLAASYGVPTYISTYEGDGKGSGKETTKGWQENRKTRDYVNEVSEVFSNVSVKQKIILAINDC